MTVNKLLNFYNSHLSNKVFRLTEPLKQSFDIDIFCYSQTKPDGSYFQVTNIPEISEHYFSNNLYFDNYFLRKPTFYETGFYLPNLPVIEEDDPGQKVMNQTFHIGNVLIFVSREKESVHNFVFTTAKRQANLLHTYLSNIQVLRTYCEYFTKEWKPHLPMMDRYELNLKESIGNKFEVFEPTMGFNVQSEKKEAFLQKIGVLDKAPSKLLSRREIDCLHQLSQGFSAKVAGKNLHLSPRTVESYIQNMKNKMNCDDTIQLIQLFNQWKGYGLV